MRKWLLAAVCIITFAGTHAQDLRGQLFGAADAALERARAAESELLAPDTFAAHSRTPEYRQGRHYHTSVPSEVSLTYSSDAVGVESNQWVRSSRRSVAGRSRSASGARFRSCSRNVTRPARRPRRRLPRRRRAIEARFLGVAKRRKRREEFFCVFCASLRPTVVCR